MARVLDTTGLVAVDVDQHDLGQSREAKSADWGVPLSGFELDGVDALLAGAEPEDVAFLGMKEDKWHGV